MAVDVDGLAGAAAIAAFGVEVSYTVAGGLTSFTVRGVFDRHHAATRIGEDGAPVSVRETLLGVRLADFPAGVEPAAGDGPVVVGGNAYDVADVRPDGLGGAALVLSLAA